MGRSIINYLPDRPVKKIKVLVLLSFYLFWWAWENYNTMKRNTLLLILFYSLFPGQYLIYLMIYFILGLKPTILYFYIFRQELVNISRSSGFKVFSYHPYKTRNNLFPCSISLTFIHFTIFSLYMGGTTHYSC